MNLTKYLRMLVVLMTVTLCFGLWNSQPAATQPKLKPGSLKSQFYDFQAKEVGGTYVVLTFKSRHPVEPLIAMGETLEQVKIKPGLEGFDFAHDENILKGTLLAQFLPGGYKTSHEIVQKDLKPDTKYYVSIIGRRESGGPSIPMVGKTFTTLQRRISFRFTKIEMIDDSDDISDGEFKFGFFVYDMYVGGSPPPLLSWYEPPLSAGTSAEHVIGSGEDLNINLIKSLLTPKRHFKIEVTAVDDDDDAISLWANIAIMLGTGVFVPVALNEGGEGVVIPHAGHGDNEYAEWGTAYQNIIIENLTDIYETVDIPAADYAETEQYQSAFIMHADPPSSDLEFKIHGHVKVSYE